MKPCARSAGHARGRSGKSEPECCSINAILGWGVDPRGLKDLRTTGALGAAKLAPHAAYMKITSLELEKLRLGRIRRQAARRIGEIDARYQEIGIEKAALLAAMEAPPQCTIGVRQGAQGSQSRRSRGVSLKY